MTPAYLSPLANHVWQSTVFSGAVMLLSLALRKNRAHLRHRLWFAASLKFLVPFSLLMSVGALVPWHTAPVVAPPVSVTIQEFAQPFTAPAPTAPTPAPWPLPFLLWALGCGLILARWSVRWLRLRQAVRTSLPLPLAAPIEVRSSPSRLEPGVFGVFRQVLVLPEGIWERLSHAEFRAILAHELCHVRRRDNLTSALHMLVQSVFWFHPLVWWIGSRLIEERERACDEEVLRLGTEPGIYAAGILSVCKFYLESPLLCAAGVTGADLKHRVEAIMSNRLVAALTPARKFLLAAAAAVSVAGPVLIGFVNAPKTLAQIRTDTNLSFEVASIKPTDPNERNMSLHITPGGGLQTTGSTPELLIEFAYDVRGFQVSGAPAWVRSERYDIVAKPDKGENGDLGQADRSQRQVLTDHLRERTRRLLADRFHLTIHRASAEQSVYILLPAKNGPRLKATTEHRGIDRNRGRIEGRGADMDMFSHVLSSLLGRPVLDRTGLDGSYGFKLEWTDDMPAGPDPKPETESAEVTGPSIFTALQEQLGLKLEPGKGPVDILVIDRVEKPSAN